MPRLHFIIFPLVLAHAGCSPLLKAPERAIVTELELVAAYPVEASGYPEPSGLTLLNGMLYSVADKVSGTIFRLEIVGDVARYVPELSIQLPERGFMDWEGITSDPGGAFYLISEERGRILRVMGDGSATWVSPDLRQTGRPLGLFSKSNAGFEGVAWLGPNHWLGAAERETRGLVELKGTGEARNIEAWSHSDSPYLGKLPLTRLPDYSGLHADGEKVYALFRNAHLVVRLEKRDGNWEETTAWSYAHIETDPRWAYRSQTYGQAEGLVVDGSEVYIILDNNRGAKQADPQDRRSLLIHARMPDGT